MRIYELAILKLLIEQSEKSIDVEAFLSSRYGANLDKKTRASVASVLRGEFFRGDRFHIALAEEKEQGFVLSNAFKIALEDTPFRSAICELIDFGIYRHNRDYSHQYAQTNFNLYKKYTYSDVCWLLNWKKEEVSLNIGGYKFDSYSKTYPVFINYEKEDDIAATTRYEDRFIDPSSLTAISKSRRTIESDDVQNAIHSEERDILMPLFVRKNKDDQTSKEFYFLGTIRHNGHLHQFVMNDTEDVTAVEIGYKLDTPVENNLYEYITEIMTFSPLSVDMVISRTGGNSPVKKWNQARLPKKLWFVKYGKSFQPRLA